MRGDKTNESVAYRRRLELPNGAQLGWEPAQSSGIHASLSKHFQTSAFFILMWSFLSTRESVCSWLALSSFWNAAHLLWDHHRDRRKVRKGGREQRDKDRRSYKRESFHPVAEGERSLFRMQDEQKRQRSKGNSLMKTTSAAHLTSKLPLEIFTLRKQKSVCQVFFYSQLSH